MTTLDRFKDLLKELWWIFGPTDSLNTKTFVVFIALVVLSFVVRKKFGGFFNAFIRFLIFGIFLLIVYNASPWLFFGVLFIFLLGFFVDIDNSYIIRIALVIALVVGICLGFYNVFMVWRKSDHFHLYENKCRK